MGPKKIANNITWVKLLWGAQHFLIKSRSHTVMFSYSKLSYPTGMPIKKDSSSSRSLPCSCCNGGGSEISHNKCWMSNVNNSISFRLLTKFLFSTWRFFRSSKNCSAFADCERGGEAPNRQYALRGRTLLLRTYKPSGANIISMTWMPWMRKMDIRAPAIQVRRTSRNPGRFPIRSNTVRQNSAKFSILSYYLKWSMITLQDD